MPIVATRRPHSLLIPPYAAPHATQHADTPQAATPHADTPPPPATPDRSHGSVRAVALVAMVAAGFVGVPVLRVILGLF